MFGFFKNIKIAKEVKNDKKFFCVVNDAIFVDEFVSGKKRESKFVKEEEMNNSVNQQQQQMFEDDSSWFI